MTASIAPIARDNLTTRVYEELRRAMMEGRFWPGHRFKIRDLAASLEVSETPVREALMQLVREKGLEMEAGRSITVAQLSLAQYLELRSIRLHLEGMAGAAATTRIEPREIDRLAEVHEKLIADEDNGHWFEAVRDNWEFHHSIYQAAGMPELLAIIEGIWLRNGPLVNYQYPNARPTYDGRHRHLDILEALRARDENGVRKGIQQDMIEGGRLLVKVLERLNDGSVTSEELRRAAQNGRLVSAAG
ncbi:GntR family transcriptional regulator [Mesorhizobium loti]|uniref:GntR family transcriptional regulator n=1 Tax=Rhizobium loti TaxID=381 RepID=UPI000406BE2A|nr:GntR family transcriptional regulator [Mesorhizobium loti]